MRTVCRKIAAGFALLGLLSLSDHGAAQSTASGNPAHDLKLTSLPLGASSAFTVGVRARGRCFFGDYDAIMLEQRMGGALSRLLISLEPLAPGDGSFRPQVREIEAGQFAQAYERPVHFSFTLPRDGYEGLVGLFICRDSNNEGACRHKAVVPYSKIFERYKVNVVDKDRVAAAMSGIHTPASDKIYFAAPLLIAHGKVVFPGVQMTDEREEEFTGFIAASLSRSATEYREALAAQRKLSKVLGSLPLGVSEGKVIEVDLPRYSPTKCGVQ